MRLLCYAALATASLVSTALAADSYGAIAYSQPSDNLAVVYGYDSRSGAETGARAACAKDTVDSSTCEVALWFQNACGAFAKADDGSWGTGWGTSIAIAETWARDTCQQHTTQGCKVEAVICTPDGEGYIK
jgi:hypothetical protein